MQKEDRIKSLKAALQERAQLRAAITTKQGASFPVPTTQTTAPTPPLSREGNESKQDDTTKADVEPQRKLPEDYTFTIDCDPQLCPMATPESSFIMDPNSDSGIHSTSNAKSSKGSGTTTTGSGIGEGEFSESCL